MDWCHCRISSPVILVPVKRILPRAISRSMNRDHVHVVDFYHIVIVISYLLIQTTPQRNGGPRGIPYSVKPVPSWASPITPLERRTHSAVPLYVECPLVPPFMPPQTQPNPCQEQYYHDNGNYEAPTWSIGVVGVHWIIWKFSCYEPVSCGCQIHIEMSNNGLSEIVYNQITPKHINYPLDVRTIHAFVTLTHWAQFALVSVLSVLSLLRHIYVRSSQLKNAKCIVCYSSNLLRWFKEELMTEAIRHVWIPQPHYI